MATIIKTKPELRWKNEINRFIRFLGVGVSGTLLDFIVLSVLKNFLGWATLPANIISYSCGIINNYWLNRVWVYPETKSTQSLVQLLRFILISLVGLVLNNLLVWALETPFDKLLANQNYGYIPAKIIATLVVLLWNFFANRFWTFKR